MEIKNILEQLKKNQNDIILKTQLVKIIHSNIDICINNNNDNEEYKKEWTKLKEKDLSIQEIEYWLKEFNEI